MSAKTTMLCALTAPKFYAAAFSALIALLGRLRYGEQTETRAHLGRRETRLSSSLRARADATYTQHVGMTTVTKLTALKSYA
ncbi:hypothetical protein EVG20_g7353 [Dentipellis fragilis]|uniref:Uncharacterized protein n=1 Tax=Dentipellis fragilis TaxID=205917 RepID=A0A4Y9YFI7_9AGAM|nr:hypothetical protein EVG20_g7353 [Dentipellis fragilis]